MKRFVKTMLPVVISISVSANSISTTYAQGTTQNNIRTNIIEYTRTTSDSAISTDDESSISSNDENNVTSNNENIINEPIILNNFNQSLIDITSGSALIVGDTLEIISGDDGIENLEALENDGFIYQSDSTIVLLRNDITYELKGDFSGYSIVTLDNTIKLSGYKNDTFINESSNSPFIIADRYSFSKDVFVGSIDENGDKTSNLDENGILLNNKTTFILEGNNEIISSGVTAIEINKGNLIIQGNGILNISAENNSVIHANDESNAGDVSILGDATLNINMGSEYTSNINTGIGGYGKITISDNTNVTINNTNSSVAIGYDLGGSGSENIWKGIDITGNSNVTIFMHGGLGIGGGLRWYKYSDSDLSTIGDINISTSGHVYIKNEVASYSIGSAIIGSTSNCYINDILINNSNVTIESVLPSGDVYYELSNLRSPAIGSGSAAMVQNIKIINSNVYAKSVGRGAVIGTYGENASGSWSTVGDILIENSNVHAENTTKSQFDFDKKGAGVAIGAGFFGTVGDLTINGGDVTAIGGYSAPGIGVTKTPEYKSINWGVDIPGASLGDITINNAIVTTIGGTNASGIGTPGIDFMMHYSEDEYISPYTYCSIGDINITGNSNITAIGGIAQSTHDSTYPGYVDSNVETGGNGIGHGGISYNYSTSEDWTSKPSDKQLENILKSNIYTIGDINIEDGVSLKAYAMGTPAIILKDMTTSNPANIINAYMTEAINTNSSTQIIATKIRNEHGADYIATPIEDETSRYLTLPTGYTAFAYDGQNDKYMNTFANGTKTLIISDELINDELVNALNFGNDIGLSEIQTHKTFAKNVLVEVADLTRNAVNIDTAYNVDKIVTGRGLPNTSITVTLVDNNNNVIATIEDVQVNENGVWELNLDNVEGVDSLENIDYINVYQLLDGNNTPYRNTEKVIILETPEINTVYMDSTIITGTGHPNSTIDLIYISEDGTRTVLTTGISVDEKGMWSWIVDNEVELIKDDKIEAIQTFDKRILETETTILVNPDSGNGGGNGNGNGGGDVTDGGGNGNGNGGGETDDDDDDETDSGNETDDDDDDETDDDELFNIDEDDVPLGIGEYDTEEDELFNIDANDVPLGIGIGNDIDNANEAIFIVDDITPLGTFGNKQNPKTGEQSKYPLLASLALIGGSIFLSKKDRKKSIK